MKKYGMFSALQNIIQYPIPQDLFVPILPAFYEALKTSICSRAEAANLDGLSGVYYWLGFFEFTSHPPPSNCKFQPFVNITFSFLVAQNHIDKMGGNTNK